MENKYGKISEAMEGLCSVISTQVPLWLVLEKMMIDV
jgi:hypothetical protein